MPREWQVPGPLTSSLDTAITGTREVPRERPPYPDANIPPSYALGEGWQLGDGLARDRPVHRDTGITHVSGPTAHGQLLLRVPLDDRRRPYDRSLITDPPGITGAEQIVTAGQAWTTRSPPRGRPAPSRSAIPPLPTLPPTRRWLMPVPAQLRSPRCSCGPPGMRPVLRSPAGAAPWVFTGGDEARLVLDGLTVSGCDIVLRGSFDTVRITACTIDPGTAGPGSLPLTTAVDGVPLAPCRIFVEADPDAPAGERGAIRQLLVDHCILGPVRTRFGGSVETLTITDSIVQGLPATKGTDFTRADVFDPSLLATSLLSADPLAAHWSGGSRKAPRKTCGPTRPAAGVAGVGSPANGPRPGSTGSLRGRRSMTRPCFPARG